MNCKYLLYSIIALLLTLICVACEKKEKVPSPDSTEEVVMEMSKSVKRGVAFGKSDCAWEDEDLVLLTPALTWSYNWAEQPQDEIVSSWFDVHGMEFCPMTWNGGYNADKIRSYAQNHPACQYLLAFNEPNLTDQARMTPSQAAAKWEALVNLAKELNLKLVSPAMNYGTLSGYSDPIKWLDEFFACDGVSIDDISAIAVHCYMASPKGLQSYVERFAKYGKPIWITEFCAWEDYAIHSVEDQLKYMCEVLNYIEQEKTIERYAWFIPRAKAGYPYMQLLTGEQPISLTDAGKIYCGFSSFDKEAWLNGVQGFSAAYYIGLSSNAIQVRPSTYSTHLMLSKMSDDMSVDYQIYLSKDVTSLEIQYASLSQASVLIYIDNVLQTLSELPASGETMQDWKSAKITLAVSKGKHQFKIKINQGVINVDNFKFD